MQTVQARVTRLDGARIMVRVRRALVDESMPCPSPYARVGSVLVLGRLRAAVEWASRPNLLFVRMLSPDRDDIHRGL